MYVYIYMYIYIYIHTYSSAQAAARARRRGQLMDLYEELINSYGQFLSRRGSNHHL